MTARDWQPGDVAMVSTSGLGERRAMWTRGCLANGHPFMPHWHIAKSGTYLPGSVIARPLAVIDPEDREQVERLAAVYRDTSGEADLKDEPWSVPGLRMQAALREFANPTPPLPEEPTETGALVKDREGDLWVRFADGIWKCLEGSGALSWDSLCDHYGPIEVQR